MARRRSVDVALADAATVPEELRSMAGVAQFYDPRDSVPEWVPTAKRERWRHLNAWNRWRTARMQWCVDSGLDYVATFHPSWLERR